MRRTTATVLFTDLVASTDLRGRLGEEAADELIRRHDRALTEAVEAHEGQVVKGLGDGIMASFTGASAGVAAAVAIQQAVDRLNRTGKAPAPLSVRVGLSAGDVAFDDDDVHGTPVIEAARLCAVAGGGEILAADVVCVLAGTRQSAGYEPVGQLELKGLPDLVSAVRVLWEPAPVSPVPLPSLLTRTGRIFVGRNAEFERLSQLWKEAVAGERRVALVAGEPGIGKTRLTAMAARAFHERGAIVLAGRCDEDLGVPYQPFVEALRHYVSHSDELRLGRHPGELVRLVPEVAEMIPGLAAPLRSDPETERYRLFDAVASWLADISRETAIVVVLDDLQWAAKPTVLLLRHVLRSAEPLRLLLVATFRDTDIGRQHPLLDLLSQLRKEPGVERVTLAGLDVAGVAAYLAQAAGHKLDEAGEELARLIWQETEGLPFFVAEVVRHLTESGDLEQREGRWVVTTSIDDLGIPEGVRDVVGRRLSRLSEDANRVLACASVAGLEFEPGVVQAAGSFDADTVFAALDQAIDARLLAEVPGPAPRNRFAHALVRTTLYDELTAARRVDLHHKVAQAIEALHAGALDDYLPALAHHWARASAPAAGTGKAVEYATRAGDRALAQLAHDEAATYYHSALTLLEVGGAPATDPRRVELLISLGQAQLRSGDPDHRQTLLDAVALAEEVGDADILVRAALANYRGLPSSVRSVDTEGVGVLERALRALPETDSTARARLLGNLASELSFSPDHQRRYRLTDDALAMARRLGDLPTLASVLAARIPAVVMSNDVHAEMVELGELADRLGDPTLTYWATVFRGMTDLGMGDIHGFRAGVHEVGRLADELGQPLMRWIATFSRSMIHRLAGRLSAAEDLARQAVEIGEASGYPDAVSLSQASSLFWVRYDQGRLGELVERCQQHAAGPKPSCTAVANLGLALVELGRLAEARPVFDWLADDDFVRVSGNYARIFELTLVAEVTATVGDEARAGTLHHLLSPHRGLVAHRRSAVTGAVDHHLALLETTLERYSAADTSFASATALHERLEAPALLARTRLEWARMLLTRRGTGDADRARELLGQALATARELGLGTVERRSVALLEQT